jgi:2'-5' RNA ligase
MTQADEQKSLRLFCAVELPPDTRARAVRHTARLRENLTTPLKVSWEREEKLHLTLKFFGDLEPEHLDRLMPAMKRAAAVVPPFAARLEGSGVFPALSRPQVLWLGVADATGKLAALQHALEEECARFNFPRDTRRFHPHVTLARVRVVNGETRQLARRHKETRFEPVSFSVGELVLFQSLLGAGGSQYVTRYRQRLGDASSGDA